MILHTVSPGQTLSAISARYGVPLSRIAAWNALAPPYALAVGQSLLIPEAAEIYTVLPGDTLSGVARRAGLTLNALRRVNPGLGGVIFPGQTLVLRLTDAPGRTIEVNGYAYPFADPAILRPILPYTTYLTPFT